VAARCWQERSGLEGEVAHTAGEGGAERSAGAAIRPRTSMECPPGHLASVESGRARHGGAGEPQEILDEAI